MMSTDRSPVGGRACLMLSIFTASTGPSAGTGSPVNGESSRAAPDVGDGAGGAGADDPVRATISPMASASAVPAADMLIAMVRWRLVMTPSPQWEDFPAFIVFAP